MSSTYYLLGPVLAGRPFFFSYSGQAKDGNNVAYFLTVIPGQNNNPDTVVFDPRLTTGSSNLTNNTQLDDGTSLGSDTSQVRTILEQVCSRNSNNDICRSVIDNALNSVNNVLATTSPCSDATSSDLVPVGDLLQLTATQVSGGWTFSYRASNQITRYLSVDAAYNLTTSTDPTTFTIIQSQVTNWPGVPFLAGIGYTFQVNGNQVNAFTYQAGAVSTTISNGVTIPAKITICTTGSGTGTTGLRANVTSIVRAVPNIVYGGTDCSGTSLTGGVPLTSRSFEAEWVFNGMAPPTYTLPNDCRDNYRYTYCTTGNVCGDGNCKGPCNTSDNGADNCQFNATTGTYSCSDRNTDQNEPWYLQPWFIILVVIFAVIFVIVIVVLVVKSEHKPDSVRYDDNIPDDKS